MTQELLVSLRNALAAIEISAYELGRDRAERILASDGYKAAIAAIDNATTPKLLASLKDALIVIRWNASELGRYDQVLASDGYKALVATIEKATGETP